MVLLQDVGEIRNIPVTTQNCQFIIPLHIAQNQSVIQYLVSLLLGILMSSHMFLIKKQLFQNIYGPCHLLSLVLHSHQTTSCQATWTYYSCVSHHVLYSFVELKHPTMNLALVLWTFKTKVLSLLSSSCFKIICATFCCHLFVTVLFVILCRKLRNISPH